MWAHSFNLVCFQTVVRIGALACKTGGNTIESMAHNPEPSLHNAFCDVKDLAPQWSLEGPSSKLKTGLLSKHRVPRSPSLPGVLIHTQAQLVQHPHQAKVASQGVLPTSSGGAQWVTPPFS